MDKAQVLVVEDEGLLCADLKNYLETLSHDVTIASSGELALKLADRKRFDVALLDINLGLGISGIETARELRKRFGIPVIFLTAHSDPATLAAAGLLAPAGFLMKPYRKEDLRVSLEMAIHGVKVEESGEKPSQQSLMLSLLEGLREKKGGITQAISALEDFCVVEGAPVTSKTKRGRPYGSKGRKFANQ